MDTVMHIIGYVLLQGKCLDGTTSVVVTSTAFFDEAKVEAIGTSIMSSERSFFFDSILTLEHREFIEDRLLNDFLSPLS